jgi:hypothetical protein
MLDSGYNEPTSNRHGLNFRRSLHDVQMQVLRYLEKLTASLVDPRARDHY